MASTKLTRTFSTNSNRKKFTVSFWVKKSQFASGKAIWGSDDGSGYVWLIFGSTLYFQQNPSSTIEFNSTAKYRDVNGWYHIVQQVDTAQATNTNRMKFWINGEQVTSWVTETYPSQNSDLNFTTGSQPLSIGEYGGAYFDGSMSHFHWCDGYTYDASAFGSTDATTGEWKINTSPSVTYGTNGFFILKDGNSVTDQSGNSNNFTVAGGTLTKTEDNPSNVFCTWNPNYRSARKDMTLTNGNTFIFEQNSGDSGVSGTIAVSSGKWYWEQIIAQVNGTNFVVIGGIHTTEDWNESPTSWLQNNTAGMRDTGNAWKGTSDLGNFTTANPNGDIFGIGFDADNGSVYFWRNGTALNSGNAIITGLDMTKTWIPFGVQHGGARVTTSTNWGNGYFQTTAVSTPGTNASGNGIFEYDVPTGYTALSTKGLNL